MIRALIPLWPYGLGLIVLLMLAIGVLVQCMERHRYRYRQAYCEVCGKEAGVVLASSPKRQIRCENHSVLDDDAAHDDDHAESSLWSILALRKK